MPYSKHDSPFTVPHSPYTIYNLCLSFNYLMLHLLSRKCRRILFVGNRSSIKRRIDLIFGVLTPLSAIFQLYHGDQFQWCKKPEYPERTTDHGQATGKLYHLRLRVECTLFVIYKAGREQTPHWWQACMSCQVIQLPNSLSHPGPLTRKENNTS